MKLTKKVSLLVIVVFAVFSVLLESLAVFKFKSGVALKNLNEVLVETKNIGSETTVAIDKLDKAIGRLEASVDKFKAE
jgi:hypothetical protein